MDVNERNELLEFLVELRDQKATLEGEVKKLNAEIEDVEAEIIADMMEHEDGKFNHKGVDCVLVQKEYVSPEPDRKNELWQTMYQQGFGELFSINSRTLQSTVKEIKSENGDTLPEWLDGLVKITEEPSLRISKGRKIKS
jgi:hypothetical protein